MGGPIQFSSSYHCPTAGRVPSFRPWEPGLYKSTKRHPAGYYIELAERYQAELDSGLFPSLRALARSEGISAARVSQLLALLRIEPDFRAELKAGEGAGWSMRRLMELAALPPEEQRATCDGRDLPHGSSGEE